MTKKIWIWLLSLFVVFWFWFTFANPIDIDWDDIPKVCYKLKNVEIDDYKVVIGGYNRGWGRNEQELYEAKKNECTKCWVWRSSNNVYLIDKNMDVKDIIEENIDSNAILIWEIRSSDCTSRYDRIETYKLTKDWNSYKIVSSAKKDLEKIRKFPLIWLFAVIIETIALFLLVKSFQKKDEIKEEKWDARSEISNKKILLWWVIPTTVTLPFLRFVLPLILWDWLWYIIIWELLITIIEAVMIKYWLNISRKRAIIASIVCNICSFAVLLIYSLLDSDIGRRFGGFMPAIIILSLVFMAVELIILFLVGNLSKEWISNKRLVLCWLITPIVDILVMLFIVRLFDDYFDISGLLRTVIPIVMKVLVDILTIKWLRKISRWKAIIASIFFNLCLAAIILALVYFFD